MTPTLLDLALKAGFSDPIEGWMGEAYEERLERFAAIITAANREAFAKIQFESLLQAIRIEPVAWVFEDDEDNGHKTFRQTPPSPEVVAYLAKWNRPAWVPLYTTPTAAQRPWVGLTDEEIEKACVSLGAAMLSFTEVARAIEAKLKEKNT